MKEQEAAEAKPQESGPEDFDERTQPQLWTARLNRLERALLKYDVPPNMSGR